MQNVNIDRMLKRLGVEGTDAFVQCREVMARADIISRQNRTNMAASKEQSVLKVLSQELTWSCRRGDCRRLTDLSSRPSILVAKPHCQFCNGSNDRAALERLASKLAAAGLSRVLVVGGAEIKHQEIRRLSPEGINWRFVDGTTARSERHYRDDRIWADVIVLWASTGLSHSVSVHFWKTSGGRTITVRRASIRQLAEGISRHVDGRPRRGRGGCR